MGFKDLFIKSDENPNDKPKVEPAKETFKAKFPTETTTPTPQTSSFTNPFSFSKSTPAFNPSAKGDVSPEHLAKAIERYQKGFESLNQPGYDFFEFYQTVIEAGADNPMAINMAFKMAKTMDKSITKEDLVFQANAYQGEIEKSYKESITNGTTKKQQLISQKDAENQALVQELGYMREQLKAMEIQIQDRENKIKTIGTKYEPQINEIDSKLAANEIAKSQLMQSIEQVKQGINNNIK